jgi:phage-related protein
MGLFSGIGDAISGAVDAIGETVSEVGDAVGDVASGIGEAVGDTFEAVGSGLGPLSDLVDGAMEVLSSGSVGGMLNTALDKLGMPDWIGDIGGGVLDFCTGNFVGAAANGLDALEDVAKACGGDELAGFLKAGSQVTGMFSGGTKVGVGQIDDLIGTASQSIGSVDDALGGVESLLDGDIVGAGEGLLDMLGGDLGPLESVVGELSDEAMGILDQTIPQAKGLLGAIGEAIEDGELSVEDLGGQSIQDLIGDGVAGLGVAGLGMGALEDLGGPVMDFFEQTQQAIDQLSLSGVLEDAGFSQPLLDGVVDAVSEALGADHPDIEKLDLKKNFASQLFEMATADPDAMGVIKDLLEEIAMFSDDIDTAAHHGASLRA